MLLQVDRQQSTLPRLPARWRNRIQWSRTDQPLQRWEFRRKKWHSRVYRQSLM